MDLPNAKSVGNIRKAVYSRNLKTICEEAACPNRAECYSRNQVTFLILGKACSRNCRFCNVEAGRVELVDPTEPVKIVEACIDLGINYIIITSVTRDDLQDGGASHFARCVSELKSRMGDCRVEVLIPDFNGNLRSVDCVCRSEVDVLAHNMETVERLYRTVRDRADYTRSLSILEHCKRIYPKIVTKSGIMLGLGETIEEVRLTLRHLRDVGCEIVTIGQYLQPSRRHLEVSKFVEQEVFDDLASYAQSLGMIAICGARVRSSFLAESAFLVAKSRRRTCV